jgi:nicotinate-nucleotide adenylyltransferase
MSQPESEPTGRAGRSGPRVAFFGGSFDPPHGGHLAVARAARDAFALDRVLFAPVGAQPLKPEGSAASFEDRVAMTRLAIEGETGFEVSLADAPKPQGEPNYTVETLVGLRNKLGRGSELLCLMGADSFFSLRRWHRAADIPLVAPLIVASRPGEQMAELQTALPEGLRLEEEAREPEPRLGIKVQAFRIANGAGHWAPFYLMPGLDVEISASGIRNEVHATGSETAGLVPERVAEYIREHRLYR